MNCRVCSGANLELFLDLGEQPHCDSLLLETQLGESEPVYPLQAFFCRDCTTVQIGHTVAKEVMFSEYLYVSGTTELLRAHFRDTTQRLLQKLGLGADDLVVDIGSNDGTWLLCYRKHGIRTLGVESAGNLAAMAHASGVKTVNRFFNADVARDILKTHGRPKLVTAAGVFFHLEELHSVTEGIRLLCGEEGVFCVQAIYMGDVLAFNQFDNFYHEHLTLWSLRAIEALLSRHGLEVFSARRLPIHGGSLELLVAAQGRRLVEPSVAELRRWEEAKGLAKIETYGAFAERVWRIKNELWSILERYRAAGKTIHAFGAPAKGATLLNSFKIGVDTVPLAVERNPLKFGRYIPGVRIPIVDESSASPPDAYLVLPWNFLSEFLRKKRDYILAGGAFIVAIPQPRVIDGSNYPDAQDQR